MAPDTTPNIITPDSAPIADALEAAPASAEVAPPLEDATSATAAALPEPGPEASAQDPAPELVDMTPVASAALEVEPNTTEATEPAPLNSGGVPIAEPTPDDAGELADTTSTPAFAEPPRRGELVEYSWWDVYDDLQRSLYGVVVDVSESGNVTVLWLGESLGTLPWADLRPVAD